MFENADLISRYTRRDALRDGLLIDVSGVAREAGIRFPTALTSAAWAKCVSVPPGVTTCQDEAGRLWDVVWMLRLAIRNSGAAGRELSFAVHVRTDDRPHTPPLVPLKAVCGPGDEGEPIVTIMLADED
jgi:hypothetical protein